MNMIDILRAAQGGRAIDNMAGNHGLNRAQIEDVLGAVIPSISTGMKGRAQQPGGLEAILRKVQGTDLEDIYEGRETRADEMRRRGGGLLEQIFGSQDVNRDVARRAGQRTGVNSGIIESLLPEITSVIMGGMQRRTTQDRGMGGALDQLIQGAGQSRQRNPQGGGLEDILGQVLGGGMQQTRPPAQRRSTGGGLGSILGAILGGNRGAQNTGGLGGALRSATSRRPQNNGLEDMLGGIFGASPRQRARTGDSNIDGVIDMFDSNGDGEVDLDVLRQMVRERR